MKLLKFLTVSVLIISLISCAFSCGKSEKLIETKRDGDFSFDLYGKDGVITRIEIKKGDKSIGSVTCNGLDFKTADLNFDGVNDIMLSSAEKGEGFYQCFIYQTNTETFTRNTYFDSMKNPVLDSENSRITCEVYSRTLVEQVPQEVYKEVRGSAVWYWKNGILYQFSEDGIEYFTDSKIYCVYTSSEVNGEITRHDDKDLWFWSYEELVAAGYDWKQ